MNSKAPWLFSATMTSSTPETTIEIFWASWAMRPLMEFDRFSWNKMMRKEIMKPSEIWPGRYSSKTGKYTKLGRINLFPTTQRLSRRFRPPSTTELPDSSSWEEVEKSMKELPSDDWLFATLYSSFSHLFQARLIFVTNLLNIFIYHSVLYIM